MIVPVFDPPEGTFDPESGAIAVPARASSLATKAANRANWLLAARQGLVFQGAWSASPHLSEGRIYHYASANCERILILAQVERATDAGGGTLTITPSDGGGTPVSRTWYNTDATTRFGSPGWTAWATVATLTKSGTQYHEVEWSDLLVRSLTIMELPRDVLDTDVDTAVALLSGDYSGLLSGRMITDGSDAGVPDLLAAIASARDNTMRHMGGILIPDDQTLWGTTDTSWANLADTALGTSGFGFRHKGRQLRSADTVQAYDVFIRAKYTGNGATVRVRSVGTTDIVTFSSLTTSFAWWAADASATLNVDADATDTLVTEGMADDVASEVTLSSVQIVPAAP